MTTLDKIKAELHATAEMHNDGDYYLRDKWVDEIIDKYAEQEPCDKCAMKNSNSNYFKNCIVAEYNGKKVSVPTKFVKQEPCNKLSQECVEPTQKHVGNALKMRCDNVVSIEAVIEWLKAKDIIKMSSQEETARKELKAFLSVRPQEPKTWHWIKHDNGAWWECSECHAERAYGNEYCPDCGSHNGDIAKMVEPQESEDNE